eukprot:3232116-Rhodomonas_salina.1
MGHVTCSRRAHWPSLRLLVSGRAGPGWPGPGSAEKGTGTQPEVIIRLGPQAVPPAVRPNQGQGLPA